MGKIFKHTRNVIAWIGPARDDSDIAIDCIAPDKLRHYEVGTKKPPDVRGQVRWIPLLGD